jgi:hypothetical protein
LIRNEIIPSATAIIIDFFLILVLSYMVLVIKAED